MESSLNASSLSDKNKVVIFVLYISVSCFCVFVLFALLVVGRMLQIGQKTRSSQQRRTYMGAHQRPSDSQAEPTIYVSPANLPPPPKYEAMAPPSYEEVVGIHYPNFQPISQPISTALAQTSNTTDTNASNVNVANNNNENAINSNTQTPSTVLSVVSERSPVVTSVASS